MNIPNHIPESFTRIQDELNLIEKLYRGGLIKEEQLTQLGEGLHKELLHIVNDGFARMLINSYDDCIINVDDDGKVFLEMI